MFNVVIDKYKVYIYRPSNSPALCGSLPHSDVHSRSPAFSRKTPAYLVLGILFLKIGDFFAQRYVGSSADSESDRTAEQAAARRFFSVVCQ